MLQAAAFTLGCLFSADAAPCDVAELTNIEGRLTHYLADLLIALGRERDQVPFLIYLYAQSIWHNLEDDKCLRMYQSAHALPGRPAIAQGAASATMFLKRQHLHS